MSIRIGLQLYSVRNTLKADPWKTLEDIAAAGFVYLEAANHNARNDPGVGFGVSASDMRSALENLGLKIVGCHVNPLDLAILPGVLDYQAELGNTQIGCDIEFYPYNDRDYVLRRAEAFNHVGEMCRERGMNFYYHNHFQEFQKFGDEFVYEIVLDNTDPDLVKIEMDTFWMYRGGVDPLPWMDCYADRIVLLHQKDFPADAPQPLNLYDGVVSTTENIDMSVFDQRKDPRCFVEIGTGILPIQDIIDKAASLPNLEYMILEQDHTQMVELDSIRTSREAFASNYTGISWD